MARPYLHYGRAQRKDHDRKNRCRYLYRLLRLGEDGKAFIAYADDCMTCYICERLCPSGAIFVHPFREELPPVFPDIPKALGGGL